MSFCVTPDGSKEGWDRSDSGDAARERFKSFLRSDEMTVEGDGYRVSCITWAEVVIDDDLWALVSDDGYVDARRGHPDHVAYNGAEMFELMSKMNMEVK